MVVLACASLLFACDRKEPFVTAVAELGDVRDFIPAVGVVESPYRLEVISEIAGRVVEVLVSPNARVSAGTPLLRIRPDKLELDLDEAVANYSASVAVVSEAQARLAQAERDLKNREFLADRGFISASALGQSQTAAQVAATALARAVAESRSASVRVGAARKSLADVTIVAPRYGVD